MPLLYIMFKGNSIGKRLAKILYIKDIRNIVLQKYRILRILYIEDINIVIYCNISNNIVT